MRLNPQHPDTERGSAMIIAVTVLMILGTLSLAVVARTLNGLRSTRQNQDFAGALANADAGMSDALFRIDQMATPASFCVGASVNCTLASVPSAPGVEYTAQVVNSSTVNVSAKGLVNGVPHAIKAQLVRSAQFPYAIYGRTAVSFHGNVDGPSCTQAQMPCEGVYSVDSSTPPNLIASPSADAATGGTIRCTGNGSPASRHVTYAGALNNGCPNGVAVTTVYDPLDPVKDCPAAPHTPTTPCRGATFTTPANCANVTGLIAPGVYFCPGGITFVGTVSVGIGSANGGKVEFFVIPVTGTADVDFNNASLNIGGDPTKFRIYMAGAGDLDSGPGQNAGAVTGILYAPSATMTNNGCKVDIRGALIINDYTCNGSPHLQIQYDQRVAVLMSQTWTLTNYTEMPTSQFGLL